MLLQEPETNSRVLQPATIKGEKVFHIQENFHLAKDEAIFLNNYILLEATALIQRRYGVETLNEFHFGMVPLLEIEWMDMSKHMQAMELLLSANRRNLSLVDISAFATMHRLGISKAFTFDRHFAEEGFEVLG